MYSHVSYFLLLSLLGEMENIETKDPVLKAKPLQYGRITF